VGFSSCSHRRFDISDQETYVNKKGPFLHDKPVRALVALAACVALSSPVNAESRAVTVKISVSTADLELSRPTDVAKMYRRLYFAARTACGNGNRVDLKAPSSLQACQEEALASAVRSANRPQLNRVYLATHTTRDAETYGIK
jgi:UrcA family protein